jgi:hypothetical protein
MGNKRSEKTGHDPIGFVSKTEESFFKFLD